MSQPLVDSDAVSQAVATALNQVAPSLKYIGTAWDQNIRRFTIPLTVMSTPAQQPAPGGGNPPPPFIAANATFTFMFHNVFTGHGPLSQFIAQSPAAYVADLEIKLMFNKRVRGASIFLYSCLSYQSDAAPADQNAIMLSPSCLIDTSGAVHVDAIPAPIIHSHVLGQYGVQKQLKPSPVVGGLARVSGAIEVNAGVAIPGGVTCGLGVMFVVVTRATL